MYLGREKWTLVGKCILIMQIDLFIHPEVLGPDGWSMAELRYRPEAQSHSRIVSSNLLSGSSPSSRYP